MSKSKILVPIDFSEQSRSAMAVACSFAVIEDAELLIVHIVEDNVDVYFSSEGIPKEEALVGLYDVLHEVKPEDERIAFSHRMVGGKPADAILKIAEKENVGLIVMGTHGRTGFKRMVLGSVAEEVVRKAACPVLTLRNPIQSNEKEPIESA